MGQAQNKYYSSNSKARKWLIDNGCVDIHIFPMTRFSKDVHIRDLAFDGICRNEDSIILFQVKSNCKPSKKVKIETELLLKKYSGVKFIWINCIDRKGIEVYGV